MDMRIALFSPVWAIRNKNRILADPPLTMPVTSACTRAICRGYHADGPGDEVDLTLDSLDIHHPCYGQLTPVKTRYPLTSITWPYCGLMLSAHRGQLFFSSWPLTRYWFPIGSQAQAQPKRGSTRLPLHQVNIFTVLYGRRYSCLGGIRFWKNLFFLHFRRF